jgi:hypothetical protein
MSLQSSFRDTDHAAKEVTPGTVVHKWITEDWLPELVQKCRNVGLVVSAELIRNLLDYMRTGVKRKGADLSHELEHLGNTIRIEMAQVTFMHIPADRSKFYDQKELLGADVNSKFHGIQYDITEAGNCYSAGRSTACVFHLMRIMETGVQEFGNKLGVTLTNEKNWQNILDEINKAIKALPHKDKATKEMSEASANLYAVKLAWRNEVMHPKDTYTLEEADNLIRQVKLFMQQLAKIV